jgi:hypothetical protein
MLILGCIAFSVIGILLIAIVAHLKMILDRPDPKFPQLPESRIISQSAVVKADADITTVQPATLGSATCCHSWDVMSDKVLEVSHEMKHSLVLVCHKCGTLDKTIVTTSKIPEPPKPQFRREDCCHKWDEEKSVRLESAFEQLSGAKNVNIQKLDIDSLPREFFRKVYTKVRVCRTCGEVNVVQASNYDIEETV